MFDAVARRYDLTNTVLSLGQDRFWRRATRSALRIGPGDKVLDLAAGTAVSTVELKTSGAWCVAADFSVGMLAAGSARNVPKVAADGTKLPFADGVFDGVTISLGCATSSTTPQLCARWPASPGRAVASWCASSPRRRTGHSRRSTRST